jgi:hypothetical protein
METYISPNYTQEKLDNPEIDDLIDVMKDRVLNWLFEPAKKLIAEKNGFLGALCLLLSYFEGVWTYISGIDSKGKSKQYFRNAFLDVFSSSEYPPELLRRVADIVYEDARCGFFHDGLLRSRIYLAELNKHDMLIALPRRPDGKVDINGKIESILIDPKYFLAAIERHFIDYLLCLRNPEEKTKRENFITIAKEKWDYEGDGTIIGLNNNGTF